MAMFNELQLTLIGAGAVAVVGVWGYNAWQEYRQRKLAQKVFSTEQADALLPDEATEVAHGRREEPSEPAYAETERIEPTLEPAPEPTVEPGFAEAEALVDAGDETPVIEPPEELADKLIDCVARIEAADMIAAPMLWAAQRKLFGKLEGRLRWCGWDENNGKWRPINAHDATSYLRLCAALQVVDRRGAISEADLGGFYEGLRQLADNFEIHIEWPAAEEVLAHARRLDEFCASVDWRIGLNLVNRDGSPIPAARLIDLATETELWLKDDGLFHAEGEGGKTLFTLSQLGGAPFEARGLSALSLPGVTLSIDVPRVADGTQAFDHLMDVARTMMSAFGGHLVDDQRAPLSDEVLATIRAKIEEFQQKMMSQNIPAGSRRALRLYD
ncbi:MAG: cell division protein ZipA C-terminal FtsZ-binding domain-containing protein [Sterolibacterium sp.]